MYIHCNLFISFIYLIDQKKVFGEFTSVCQRRRFPCACGRAVAAEEEANSSGVDDGGGDRRSRERWGLREFWNEKRNNTGQTTIYMFENITSDY
jgi:hypothetical protein